MIVYQFKQIKGKKLLFGRLIKKRISNKYAKAFRDIRKRRRE